MKLHIGCGSVKIPGYTNVDIRYLPNVDVVDNAIYLRKFQNEFIEEIYACHVLEHFIRWETDNVLKRWYNLLCPKGVLYISVPDFDAIVNFYNKTGCLSSLIGLLYGGQDYAENSHHKIWNFETMANDLYFAGFKNIERYDWKLKFPGFDDYSKSYLPHKDFENGMLMSLNIRAER